MGSVSCCRLSDLTPLPLSSHLGTLVTTLGPPRSSRTISPIQGYLIGTLDATCCLSFPLPGIFTGSGVRTWTCLRGHYSTSHRRCTHIVRTHLACFYSSIVHLLRKEAWKVLEQETLRFGLSNVTESVFSPGLCLLSLSQMQAPVLSTGMKPFVLTVSLWGNKTRRWTWKCVRNHKRCTMSVIVFPAFLALSNLSALSPKPKLQLVCSRSTPTGLRNILST